MNPQKLQMLKTQVNSYKRVLGSATPKEKNNHASLQVVDNFNRILEDVRTACPQIAESLPSPIEKANDSFAHHFGISRSTYMDLLIYCDQISGLLECIESSN